MFRARGADIDQIHGLILEDRRISAKSIAEQLGISRERVGSIIHEIWTRFSLVSFLVGLRTYQHP
jgi:predicted XRE-type DNA-binding protein